VLISPFSAISSWEGYEYQGHIAIFVVLQKIRKLIAINNNVINDFTLEIEGAEDFSIKENDNYITLHQVKSGTIDLDQNEKKDKFCFIVSLLQYNAKYGYFHILPNKMIPNDFVKSTSDWIDTLLIDLDKDIKHSNEVEEADDGKYIIINKIIPNTKKGSLYNIINFKCNGNKEKGEIQRLVKDIKTELITYKEKLKNSDDLIKDDQLLSKYDQNFNNSQEIQEASCSLIREILNIVKPEWRFIDNDYLEFVYGQIFLDFKNHATNHFINKAEVNTGCQITFLAIFTVLTNDYHSNFYSTKYQYFLLWKSIRSIFEQFPSKNKILCKADRCEECDETPACNLIRQLQIISKIEEEDLHNFLYRLILKEPEKGKPNNLPDDNLINRLFISVLKEIELLSFEKNNVIQAQKDGLFYRLTLNASGDVHELQETINREVHASVDDKLLIYESDVLITDQLNEENFIYNGINTTVIGEKEFRDLKDITSDSIDKIKKNYNKPKIMRLIDRKNAKKELSK